jgi:hypothetical protein
LKSRAQLLPKDPKALADARGSVASHFELFGIAPALARQRRDTGAAGFADRSAGGSSAGSEKALECALL